MRIEEIKTRTLTRCIIPTHRRPLFLLFAVKTHTHIHRLIYTLRAVRNAKKYIRNERRASRALLCARSPAIAWRKIISPRDAFLLPAPFAHLFCAHDSCGVARVSSSRISSFLFLFCQIFAYIPASKCGNWRSGPTNLRTFVIGKTHTYLDDFPLIVVK